jgi:hypothetical protein
MKMIFSKNLPAFGINVLKSSRNIPIFLRKSLQTVTIFLIELWLLLLFSQITADQYPRIYAEKNRFLIFCESQRKICAYQRDSIKCNRCELSRLFSSPDRRFSCLMIIFIQSKKTQELKNSNYEYHPGG